SHDSFSSFTHPPPTAPSPLSLHDALPILCTPGVSEVRRTEALACGLAAVLEIPFEKRLLFNAVHSATAVQGGQEGVISLSDYYADRKSTRLNSSHVAISYAVFCLKKKKKT